MKLNVETFARADLPTVWSAYNTPDDITKWNSPSDDWHSPRSQVDLREGGTFNTRMEAKDGSFGFDFEGTYTRVVPQELIEYRMSDGREAAVRFTRNQTACASASRSTPKARIPWSSSSRAGRRSSTTSGVMWRTRLRGSSCLAASHPPDAGPCPPT